MIVCWVVTPIEFLCYGDRQRMRAASQTLFLMMIFCPLMVVASTSLSGRVTDPQGRAVSGAGVHLGRNPGGQGRELKTDDQGKFAFDAVEAGEYSLRAEADGLNPVMKSVAITNGQSAIADLQFSQLTAQRDSIVITAKPVEPEIDLRNAEAFNRTLFTRDDQVLQQLNAGISRSSSRRV